MLPEVLSQYFFVLVNTLFLKLNQFGVSHLTVLEKTTYITSGYSATYLNKAPQSLKDFFH